MDLIVAVIWVGVVGVIAFNVVFVVFGILLFVVNTVIEFFEWLASIAGPRGSLKPPPEHQTAARNSARRSAG
jgi:hypothetical protein